jgi:hypothetical protein
MSWLGQASAAVTAVPIVYESPRATYRRPVAGLESVIGEAPIFVRVADLVRGWLS